MKYKVASIKYKKKNPFVILNLVQPASRRGRDLVKRCTKATGSRVKPGMTRKKMLHLRFSMTKRTFAILLLVLNVQLTTGPVAVYAEEATQSAQTNTASASAQTSPPSATSSAQTPITTLSNANPFLDDGDGTLTQNPVSDVTVGIGGALSDSLQAASSALIRQKVVVETFAKKVYKAGEQIQTIVENAKAQEIQATVLDDTKTIAPVVINRIENGGNTTLQIQPLHSFRPGKYTLQVTVNGQTSSQDFTWGVLAINTNKSVYAPGENADIAMGVLDDAGKVICDAMVHLQILDPQEKATDLTTWGGDIAVNPECQEHAVTVKPDYETHYQVAGAGTYTMNLDAKTKNGTYHISDSFQVQDNAPFNVERQTATRIYPANTYPVNIHITANQDFTGSVTEYLPESFQVTPTTEAQSYNSIKTVDVSAASTDIPDLAMPFDDSYRMTQGFGEQLTDPDEKAFYKENGLIGHDGLDFALPLGTQVKAADGGKVVLAGDGAYGTTIVIQHSWGKSYYGHLSKLEVKVGDTVSQGQEIALSGNSGHTTGAHLHFGIKPNNAEMENGYYGKVDPAPYLQQVPTSEDSSQASVLGASTFHASNGVKAISWYVSLKKGQSVTIGYNYKAPEISPYFYTLGPLQFRTQGKKEVFAESRQWQIAVDAMSGQMTLYFHREKSGASANYNALTLTPPEVGSDTASGSTSTTNVSASPPTSFCESADNTSTTFNKVSASGATSTGERCMASFISLPVGQSFTMDSVNDTTAIAANIWMVNSSTKVTAAGVKIYLYKWDGTTLTLFKTLTNTTSPGTTVTQASFAATKPDTTVSFTATDRVAAIVTRSVTATSNSTNISILFDSTARAAASITLKYTAITPNKPTLNATYGDDFTTAAATTNCTNTGVTYNTKWTCISPTTGTVGTFSADSSSSTNSSQWLILTAKQGGTLGTTLYPTSNGANSANTFIYQTDPNDTNGQLDTVVNSTMNASNTSTAPFSHAGLFLEDTTHSNYYLQLTVGYDGTNIGVWINNNSTTKGSTTAISSNYSRIYLRWQKIGTKYTGYYSTDGSTYTSVGSVTIASSTASFNRMGLTAYAGVLSTSYGAAFEWFNYQIPSGPTTFNQRQGGFENDESQTAQLLTSYTPHIGERVRIKLQVDTNAAVISDSKVFKLQYDKNDNSWVDVKPSGEIRPAASIVVQNGAVAGSQDTGTCTSGTTASQGVWYSGVAVTQAISFAGSTCKEIGFVVSTSNANPNITYRFRLYNMTDNAAITLPSGSSYPSFTTVTSTNNIARYSKSNVTSLATAQSDLKNMLDKSGYSNVNTADTANEILQNVQNNITGNTKTGANANNKITGETASSNYGLSVAVGDVNGDGYQDIVVGAYGYNSSQGRIYIYYGGKAFHTSADITITGENTSDNFGYSLVVGDVNGDGYQDIVVGAYGYNSVQGRVYVFYGGFSLASSIAASSANIILTGESASDQFGLSVNLGDINRDGYQDIVITAPVNSVGALSGKAYVFYGSSSLSGSIAASSANIMLTGQTSGENFGYTTAIGDVNGDGYPDIAVGAASYKTGTQGTSTGRAYIFLGTSSWSASIADTSANVIITGASSFQFFGSGLAIGDVNGDGYQDVVVGSQAANTYIFYGSSSWSASISATSANVTITSEGGINDHLGLSLAMGDVNGDGYQDIIVGAEGYTSSQGRVYVFYGGSLASSIAASSANVILTGESTSNFGRSVAVGDANGDGYQDIIIGAPGYTSNQGRAYTFLGSYQAHNTFDRTINGETSPNATSYFGFSVATGDVNGDGYADIIVGAYNYNSGQGRVYVYYGGKTIHAAADVTLTGDTSPTATSQFGSSVATGDVNGDGYQDIIVGAPGYSTYYGAVYIFYGSSSLSSAINASSANVLITGATQFEHIGNILNSADINGDGYQDIIVGTYNYGSNTGIVYVFYGSSSLSSSISDSSADVTITDNDSQTSNKPQFGSSVATGDVNGDGYQDIIVGAPFTSYNFLNQGATYVFYGSSSLSTTLTTSSANITLTGENNSALGGSAATGDINGDGYQDIIIGGTSYGSNQGRAYIFYGSSSLSSSISASSANVILTGESGGVYNFGGRIGSGDINGDGYQDLVIDATNYNSNQGRAYIFYGTPGLTSKGAASADIILTGEATGNYFGASLALDDLNGDGYADIVAGAYLYNSGQGRTYITLGGGRNEMPTFNFAAKSSSTCSGLGSIAASWQGQSNVAASSNSINLDVYNFNTSSWETVTTESALGANTAGTINGSKSASLGNYCDASNWSYWRISQASGQETMQTDVLSVTFTASSGPTLDQLLKGGMWWNSSGQRQLFTF